MKKIIISSILILQLGQIIGQTIEWQDLDIKKVISISGKNDSLIIIKQLLPAKTNGLADKISSTDVLLSTDVSESKRIKSEFDRIVNSYINKNIITDNNEIKERYAITKIGHQYELKKHKTIKRYLFWEGAGVQSYISIDESPGYSESDIYCIFNDDVVYKNSKFSFITISPQNGKRYIDPHTLIKFDDDDHNNYEITYLADLCEGSFEYKGFGTILPTYFNIVLRVKDINSDRTQTLLQIPHEHIFRLSKFQLADINSDGKLDIVVQLETDLCSDRIIYLSSENDKKNLFKYIGRMMINCDYP